MRIGTHSGKFHCDEVLACMMLTKYTNKYKNSQITRSRDLSVLGEMDIVVDVGGVYDHSKQRYDHHQKEFSSVFPGEWEKVKMSSAGLVYLHYGREVIDNMIKQSVDQMEALQIVHHIQQIFYDVVADQKSKDDLVEEMFNQMYKRFIRCFDAIDNGVDQVKLNKGQELLFDNPTGLDWRVARLNPSWTSLSQDTDGQFQKALIIAEQEMLSFFQGLLFNWYPAKPIVRKAILDRAQVSKSGKIIVLSSFCPWKDHLFTLEKEMNLEQIIQFVVFKDGNNQEYRVQAINLKDSFALRTPLKESWRGITDMTVLKEVSGIHDIVFCHTSGFIGGAKSLDNAVLMAELSL